MFFLSKDEAELEAALATKGNVEGFHPSSEWYQGGPIIEREGISWHCGNKTSWHAYAYGGNDNITGPTPLIAAMRCYAVSKLGDEAEVPDEFLEN